MVEEWHELVCSS